MMHDDIPCFPSMEENCSELHVNLKIVEKVSVGFSPGGGICYLLP